MGYWAVTTNELALALLRDGCRFASHMGETTQTPAAQRVRVLGRRALLVAGEDAVRFFYDPEVMRRSGAVPAPLSDELFGVGTVHGLDGTEHAHRKELHLTVLGPQGVDAFTRCLERSWSARTSGAAPPQPGEQLFAALTEALGTTALEWAGLGSVDASE